jgi:iron complex outermembrane receptor protein
MNPHKRSALIAGLMVSSAVLSAWPLAASAQVATPVDSVQSASATDQTVVLSPFTVTTDKDNGYGATNQISGSRVNTPIKDTPITIQVITSQFLNDIGATDLRSSLSYTSGIMLQTQNDLENGGGTYGSPYGPGGVNNPQGLTSNINQVQLKIRGFITNNVLRDGFLRASSTDSVNIDRIEVVEGPNALLYGTGNFGGVVDYLTKQPLDVQQGSIALSVGTYDFMRSAVDFTGPISKEYHIDYRVDAAIEYSKTNIDYQKNHHYFVAPSVSWKPTPTTTILVDTEFGQSYQNGYGFQALRAVNTSGAAPINNDQIEAVSFYFPAGVNRRTYNLSGPDTFNNQDAQNLELKLTQTLLNESEYLPRVDLLLGYNSSKVNFHTRNLAGGIGSYNSGSEGGDMAQIITITAANSIDGQGSNNLNLNNYNPFNALTNYQWYTGDQTAKREQERAELSLSKSLFQGKWFQLEDQVLAGYSEIRNDISSSGTVTQTGKYNHVSPNTKTGIVFGKWGNGTADYPMYTNDMDNNNTGWDAGFYLNNYFKFLSLGGVADRIILMNGIRHDRNANASSDTNFSSYGATPTTTSSRSDALANKSYQNGIIFKLTKNLSVYGLRSQGIQPNFGGLHNGVTGGPVTADKAKSEEFGIKFDFLDGKISGTIAHYKITKTAWQAEPWYAPAPMGKTRFDPSKDIIYELSGGAGGGGFNSNGVAGATPFPAAPAGAGVWDYTQSQPSVVAAWNAAVAAGAIYQLPTGPRYRIYLDASKATGAAYLDAAFAANQASNGDWPGWLYQGDSEADPNINNATMDAAGFYNTSLSPAWQIVDQAKGWDGSFVITPNDHLQIVMNASINATVTRLNLGTWPKYPYPQDRWAVWYFQNGGFGLVGQPLNVAYTNPQDTSTRTNAGVYPGDDTPKYAVDMFMNYKFSKAFSAGIGGQWHSKEEYFSGVTHGGQQVEQNAAGKPIVAFSPDKFTLNLMAKYEWKSGGHNQYVQLNVDNLLNDTKLYGLIYNAPMTAKVAYGIGF